MEFISHQATELKQKKFSIQIFSDFIWSMRPSIINWAHKYASLYSKEGSQRNCFWIKYYSNCAVFVGETCTYSFFRFALWRLLTVYSYVHRSIWNVQYLKYKNCYPIIRSSLVRDIGHNHSQIRMMKITLPLHCRYRQRISLPKQHLFWKGGGLIIQYSDIVDKHNIF